jgi:hypothetical protein
MFLSKSGDSVGHRQQARHLNFSIGAIERGNAIRDDVEVRESYYESAVAKPFRRPLWQCRRIRR